MFTGEYERFNLFNEKSDVRISAKSITLRNDEKTRAVFTGIKFIASKCGIYRGDWDFYGVQKLRALGVTEHKNLKSIFEYKGGLFYLKPSLGNTDTSTRKDIHIVNVGYVSDRRAY